MNEKGFTNIGDCLNSTRTRAATIKLSSSMMIVSTEYPITCTVFLSYILKIAPMIETQSILTNTTTVRLTHMRKRVKHTQ